MALCVVLSGCVTTSGDQSTGDSVLQSTVDDYSQTVQQGAVGGAVIGALVGGALGAIFGGDAKSAAIGAGAGALVGGGAGAAVGQSTADAKQEQIAQEEELDAQIKQTEQAVALLTRVTEQARVVLDGHKKDLETLKTRYTDRALLLQSREKTLNDLRADKKHVEAAIKEAEAQRETLLENIAIQGADPRQEFLAARDRVTNELKELRSIRDGMDDLISSPVTA